MRSSIWKATLKDRLVRLSIMALMVIAVYALVGIKAAGVVIAFIILVLVAPYLRRINYF